MQEKNFYWKEIAGKVYIHDRRVWEHRKLGIAGRDKKSLVALIPYYDPLDINYDQDVSLGERMWEYIPFVGAMSKTRSPLKWLAKYTLADPDFCRGRHDQGWDQIITQTNQVVLSMAVATAGEVIVDAYINRLLGPVLGEAIKAAVKGGLTRFFLNQAAEDASKKLVMDALHVKDSMVKVEIDTR